MSKTKSKPVKTKRTRPKKARSKTASKSTKTKAKPKAALRRARAKQSFEERLLAMDDEKDFELPSMNEKMREKLLREEFKLRKKQPTAWTKTKYRKYALLNRPKKPKPKIVIQEEHELKE